jgi:glycosyltransferase involved in cell wall biosynthesis
MATICWNFPIYSQTFVYQELSYLQRGRFELRHAFSRLESRDGLPRGFRSLWTRKRRTWQDPALHRADYESYRSRMPNRVERLVELLSNSSSLSQDDVQNHADFLRGFTFTRLAEAWAPQYLHSYFFYDQSLHALVAAYLLELPRGVSCYADHLLNDYELKVVPLHLAQCDVVVATSERIRNELLSMAPGIQPAKVIVKPNAIDCRSFPVFARKEPALGEPFRIVCVSRIEPKKGILFLVEAVRILRNEKHLNVELHIIGEADPSVPASEEYKDQLDERLKADRLWETVHLEGRRSHPQVRRFLETGHIFAAPFVELASGDKDGIPTALLEAMSSGMPPVVTDAGSISEVVQPECNGLVVPQRDALALASALERLISDHDMRTQLGTAAAKTVRAEFDVEVRESALGDAILSILARHP